MKIFGQLHCNSSNKFSFSKLVRYCIGSTFFGDRMRAQYVIPWLNPKPSDLVLDLGCGCGNYANFIAWHYGSMVIGIDRLSNQVVMARKTARCLENNNKFFVDTIESFNTSDRFNKIICIEVLEHLEKPYIVFEKADKLLKPEGLLIIHTPNFIQHHYILRNYKNNFPYGKDRHLRKGFSVKELNELAKERFKLVRWRYTFQFFSRIGWEISNLSNNYFWQIISFILFYPISYIDKILPKDMRGNGILAVYMKK